MIDTSRAIVLVALASLLGGGVMHCHRAPSREGPGDSSTPSTTPSATTASAILAVPPPPRRTPRSDLATTSASIALGNLDAQIDELSRLVTIDPKSVARRRMRADAHHVRGKHRGDLDEIQLGIDEISRCIALDPKSGELYLDRANQEQSLHRFKEARADVARARELGAAPEAIAAALQELDWNDGHYEAAIAAIRAARERHPTMMSVARVAQLEHDLGAYDAADRAFDEAEALYNDTNPIPLAWLDVQRGLHALHAGRLDEAITFYRDAVKRIPTFIMANEHLAEALHMLGQDDEAISIYEDVVARSTDPEFMGALAAIYREKGRTKEADVLHAKATRGYEARLVKYPEAMYWHAAEYFSKEGANPKKALDLLTKNLALRPNAVSLVALAAAQLETSDVKGARASIDRALAMPVRSAELYWTAARVYEREGEAARSEELAASARGLNPRVDRVEPPIAKNEIGR